MHYSLLEMKVFIVFAHPEPKSLNGALLRLSIDELESQGHEVRVSDLYAMKWKSEVDRADYSQVQSDERMIVARAMGEATILNTLTYDVKQEQEKLLWADIVIFQFPLWWYTMPAILLGWVDRVYTAGFAFGLGEYSDNHWGDRYGEGKLLGKRAMLLVTVGSWREHFSSRGICGPINDVLFPLNHGILFYIGLEVLPPFIVYQADRMDDETFHVVAKELRHKLSTIAVAKPIAYRRQNDGDYEIPSLILKAGREEISAAGFSLHSRKTNP